MDFGAGQVTHSFLVIPECLYPLLGMIYWLIWRSIYIFLMSRLNWTTKTGKLFMYWWPLAWLKTLGKWPLSMTPSWRYSFRSFLQSGLKKGYRTGSTRSPPLFMWKSSGGKTPLKSTSTPCPRDHPYIRCLLDLRILWPFSQPGTHPCCLSSSLRPMILAQSRVWGQSTRVLLTYTPQCATCIPYLMDCPLTSNGILSWT